MEWSWSWYQYIDSYKEFKGKISPFMKIKSNSVFSVYDVYGVKLLSRLRLFQSFKQVQSSSQFQRGK